MKRILSFMPKKTLAFALLAGAVIGVTAAAGAWWPERPTYTMAVPADHVTFNSITDNPREGDERAFFEAKDNANKNSDGFAHTAAVKDGETVLVRVYVHNDAASNLNSAASNYKGIAKDANVHVWLPSVKGSVLRAAVDVSSSNAVPATVSDTLDFYSATGNKFTVEYVPGSARIYNNAITTKDANGNPIGAPLNDSIVSKDGVKIGYQPKADGTFDGTIPGCLQYASVITLRVKVHEDDFTVNKSVSKITTVTNSNGVTSEVYDWKKNVVAAPSETVAYQIAFNNTGNTNLTDVVLRDQLPKGFAIVPGTTVIKYGSDPTVNSVGNDNIVANGGLILNSASSPFAPNSGAVLMFKATAPASADLVCGANKLTNIAEASADNMKTTDTADVTIDRTEGCGPAAPAYSCDLLGLTVIGDRQISVKTDYTAINGATLNNISYNFGDGTPAFVTKATTATHTYAADGTYTVRATPSFMVNGQLQTADSAACAKVVTFVGGKPVTPPTSTPDTGPTQTIGLFIGASIVSAIGYRLWMIRRLGN